MEKDPTELTDKELDAAIAGEEPKEEEVKEVPESETPIEETPEEEPEDQEPEEEPEVEEERPVSRRESLRIAKLVERGIQQRTQPQSAPDYSQMLEADPETLQQIQQKAQEYGQTQYNQGLEQAKTIQFTTRLEIDAPKIENKYKQLNPQDKENFDPVIADALNTHYLNLVGYDPNSGAVQNPNLRYADFVDAQYELAGALANDQVAKTSKNIAKQASATGIRPDGSKAKRLDLTKEPGMMSNEELDAYLAKHIPK